MTEDQDLLARIGQVAGQINQHKSQSSSKTPSENLSYAPYHAQSARSRGWAPYRGRGRPPTRRPVASHRNRTLVLNNNQGGSAENPTGSPSPGPSSDNMEKLKPISSSGWVAKRDRHMQLINPVVYDKESQAKIKAIEESLKLKAQKKTEREEAQVMRHAQGVGSRQPIVGTSPAPGGGSRSTTYQIVLHDIPFQVVKGGSKLIRVSSESHCPAYRPSGASLPLLDDPTTAGATPKRVKVGGVEFVRSKKGNLHRLGAVASKRFVVNKEINFAALANGYFRGDGRRSKQVKKKNELCKRFTTTGSCHKGPSCPFVHDATKVAICKNFLQTGKCDSGMACDLSHDPTPERSPVCVHFLRGRCSNPECRYAHIRVTPGAPVCRAFATLGYCDKGADCDNRHVHECPDYANTGTCGNKKCTLPHVDRAGQIRKLAANNAASPDPAGDDDDISSDEEDYEEIDSGDVDSDELEDDPMDITDGADNGEISQQRDFVGF